ncbi:MAG: TonB-dependent receptor, partial [Burkholderiales bacterium]|nr:TonB-dependent receptor [Burkholderiales bacterium]
TRTDIGARYLMDLGNNRLLTLRARVDNLFDRKYWASVGGYPGSNYLVQSTPRTFTISASMDF